MSFAVFAGITGYMQSGCRIKRKNIIVKRRNAGNPDIRGAVVIR